MSGVEVRERPASQWSELAIGRLLESALCPVCEQGEIDQRRCVNCGADFTGPIGGALWDASRAAAAALRSRQGVLDRVPLTSIEQRADTPANDTSPAAHGSPPAGDRDAASVSRFEPEARSSATLQSVLAVSGAGLVAVAAIVFTFFNPDLTDALARNLIIAAITLGFLGGAVVLARRGLQFSAEAVGALGLVFLAIDVSSLAQASPASLSPWVVAAVGTLVAGGAIVRLGAVVGIRVWVWSALLALAFVPVMLGAAESTVGLLVGSLTAAAAAFALVELAARLARRFDGRLQAERITLTVVQVVFVASAPVQLWLLVPVGSAAFWSIACAVFGATAVLGALSARHPAGRLWSVITGTAGVGAVAALPAAVLRSGVVAPIPADWYIAITTASAVAGLILVAAVLPLPSRVDRGFLTAGALSVVFGAALLPTGIGLLYGAVTVAGAADGTEVVTDAGSVTAVTVSLAALAIGLIVFARLTSRTQPTRWLSYLGEWYAVAAVLTLMTSPAIVPAGRIAIGLGCAILLSAALAWVPRVRDAAASARLPLIVGAHILVLLAAVVSWRESVLTVVAGIAIVITLTAVARTVRQPARFVHVGIGYAYALAIFAIALGEWGVPPVALLCLTTSIGGIGAIVATFVPRVSPRAWYAVLAVTAVPFALGVGQVIFERSAWTALSTSVIFMLALTLVMTRRAGLGVVLRSLAAGVLVPSLAVVAVCVGAELLLTSGSPVVLPVIATIIAAALPSLPTVHGILVPRIGERDAAAARLAIEASALLTAAIAVLLSLAREAAGLSTTLLVLVILGVGFGVTSLWAGRRYGWWLAGAAFTGALWCAWGLAGVDGVEPYLLPPALAATVIAAVLAARGTNARALYTASLSTAVVPLLVLLAVGADAGGSTPWRAFGLVAASWLLLLVTNRVTNRLATRVAPGLGALETVRMLRPPTLFIAIIAGAAGAIQGARWGFGLDATPAPSVQLVVVCFAIGIAGAVPAALAAHALRATGGAAGVPQALLSRTRWLYVPAAIYIGAATWPSIHRDWFTIWSMWTLMLAYLAVMVVVAVRGRIRSTGLPPVWVLFALAFVTAVVAWSPRDLRVEWFALPLGLFLLAVGVIGMRAPRPMREPGTPRRSLSDWPAGFTGSWALLAPGIIVTFSASVTATYTDPLTWRAILVIVLALIAILVGSSAKLAAPFLIGIVVLPVENALAFLVQIGRGIESMPWWITLAVVGAVLLIIAVTYERRAGEGTGFAARIRDLA